MKFNGIEAYTMHRRVRMAEASRRARAQRSPETLKKQADALARGRVQRYRCGGCAMVTTAGALGRHQRSSGHEDRTLVAVEPPT